MTAACVRDRAKGLDRSRSRARSAVAHRERTVAHELQLRRAPARRRGTRISVGTWWFLQGTVNDEPSDWDSEFRLAYPIHFEPTV
jgi:hypothetical protein